MSAVFAFLRPIPWKSLAALALLGWTAVALPAAADSRAGPGLVLLTSEDAKMLRLGDGEPILGTTRSLSRGPRVVVEAPALRPGDSPPRIAMTSPGDLSLRFEQNGAPVDMGSLEVSARKGFFSKSLTDLLRPYVDGSSLRVKQAEVPEGSFLIEILIADVQGTETAASYRLDVSGR